uniref:Amphiphysin n=1 Tax=Aceria tosichella TaxID=561515 RepID=A0A6G1S870_9ACAR
MNDTKAQLFSSLVTKKTRRAKERLLQNFGKADKTTDELFEVYQLNFNRQQSTALNFQKHVRHYVACLKELNEAAKTMNSCLLDMYENDWPKHETFENNIYEANHINEELEEKIRELVLNPLEQYLGQFSGIREKIAKRARKLVDYDSQRHSFETLKQNQNNKQPDDAKLSKHRDHLEEARRIYETLNNELHEELPALYDNRLPFIITVFQRLFASHVTYHADGMAVQKSYLEVVEQLAKATQRGVLNTVKPLNSFHNNQLSSPPSSSATNNDKLMPMYPQSDLMAVKNRDLNQTERKNVFSTEPSGPPITNKQPKPLYKVRATYKYLAEDEDELSFEAGDIIQVIEYDDPSEQEEGWLMGIKESDQQKGLFPANFTKEI